MEDKLKELLAFVEEDAKHWEDVAEDCEKLIDGLPEVKKAQQELLCAVYRERAKLHRDVVAKFRQHP